MIPPKDTQRSFMGWVIWKSFYGGWYVQPDNKVAEIYYRYCRTLKKAKEFIRAANAENFLFKSVYYPFKD